MQLDAEIPAEWDDEDPDSVVAATDEEFDAEIAMAAQGRWEELGLDPAPGTFEPVTVSEFLNAD